MSYAAVRAVLENADMRIEIYKQDVRRISSSGYINYSNKFLSNKVDHFIDYRGTQRIGNRNVNVTSWRRNKLSAVENDKNHYVCLEISSGNFVYTIFIKSVAPVDQFGGYRRLAESFKTGAATALPYLRVSQAVNAAVRGWNEETEIFYQKYFGGSAPLTWGMFEPAAAYSAYGKLKSYEEYFGYEFPIILNYSNFQNTSKHPNLRYRLDMAYSNNKTLILTLQTIWLPDGSNMVYKILNGEYDEFLQDYAEVIADFGHPVLFRLGNEMNGDWCPYSSYNTSKDTIIFTEFYRYVYGFFERAGANANSIWVWNPNGGSYPDFKWNDELMYYPGDNYVDIVGLTRYNTGTFYRAVGEKWQEFHELYDGLYSRYSTIYGQPLMIPEFASASMGGDKEQWVRNMFEVIRKYDGLKVAVWWNSADYDIDGNVARSYFIDETPELMEIFRQNLSAWATET